ncbi:MAG: hypothetical protein GDA44_13685 [Prochloron sp. SP5CPC1]|nr:hypothetical protein [Candidatus Paraprochloron terpiosi SP5CPC1]
MVQDLVDLVRDIDFSALRQWLTITSIATVILTIATVILTITNLIINLPKAYSQLKGTVAELEVKRFSLVKREPGLVDFQLDLCIYASYGNVVIKGIYLINKNKFHLRYNEPICLYNEPDNNSPSSKAEVKLAIPKTDFDFTQLVENKFEELFSDELRKKQINILGFQVPEDSFKCLTMAGRLKGKILDKVNFSNIPLKDWSVLLEHGKGKAKAPLQASIINVDEVNFSHQLLEEPKLLLEHVKRQAEATHQASKTNDEQSL